VLKYKYKNAKRDLSKNIGWDLQIAERSGAILQKGVASQMSILSRGLDCKQSKGQRVGSKAARI
jgi:hypothetical protein